MTTTIGKGCSVVYVVLCIDNYIEICFLMWHVPPQIHIRFGRSRKNVTWMWNFMFYLETTTITFDAGTFVNEFCSYYLLPNPEIVIYEWKKDLAVFSNLSWWLSNFLHATFQDFSWKINLSIYGVGILSWTWPILLYRGGAILHAFFLSFFLYRGDAYFKPVMDI